MRIYAIGDIHGQRALLSEAHRRIAADGGGDALVVHVGDLIDKGPDSRGVIDDLMRGQAQGRNWAVLKGNHDRMLCQFMRDPHHVDSGVKRPLSYTRHPDIGAAATLASYGVDSSPDADPDTIHAQAVRAIPPAHLRWLAGLPCWRLTPLALFVHAGVRPGIDLLDQTEDDLLWLRKGFVDCPWDHGILVVHGHTPVRQPAHLGWRLAIDTGAAYGGPLTAVRLDRDGVWLLTDDGAQPLPPGAGA